MSDKNDSKGPQLKFESLDVGVHTRQRLKDAITAAEEAHKARVSLMKKALDNVEAEISRMMKDSNQTSGTFGDVRVVREEKDVYSAESGAWDKIWAFCVEQNRPNILQRRLNSDAINEYKRDNKGVLPPGVTSFTKASVKFTTVKAKRGDK